MQSKTKTVEGYLSSLPADRRAALEALRKVILANLDKDYEEGVQYGMIGYYVPHRVYPAGYHCDPRQPLPFSGLASQKNHMALYMACVYGNSAHDRWFRDAWARTGKKLDMGKACIRFKRLEDLPLEVIGEAIRRIPAADYIRHYEMAVRGMASHKPAKPARATPKAAPRKTPKRAAAPKRTARRAGNQASKARGK